MYFNWLDVDVFFTLFPQTDAQALHVRSVRCGRNRVLEQQPL